MDDLEAQLRALARKRGATLVGITTAERLHDGPPSAEPRYVLPSARSVISLAVALDPETVRRFIAKEDWTGHCHERKRIARTLYEIGDALVDLLEGAGFETVTVDPNMNYRPEDGAADVTEMTEFHPDFSLRYAAVAAGVGRLGWSGNLITAEHGSLVELGAVMTAAELTPDEPLEVNPCDQCKLCTLVCPVQMMHGKRSTTVSVAGVNETIAEKRPNTCCWIGCTGYEGLSTNGKWSNWSPYRLDRPLPKDRDELNSLCIRLQKADPQTNEGVFDSYRGTVFDPDWFYSTVCGFCRAVCWPNREDRNANHRAIIQSGTAALRPDGAHVVADTSSREIEAPFGFRAVVAPGAKDPSSAKSTLDRAVVESLTEDDSDQQQ